MTLGSPVQMYRFCNTDTQTGVWRHAYAASPNSMPGWTLERALGRMYMASDTVLSPLNAYTYDLATSDGKSLNYYRLGTSPNPPTAWAAAGTVGYIYQAAPTDQSSVPLYELSYSWNGYTLYFYTTSEFERDLAVATDGMSELGIVGYLLPASLSMVISTGSTPGSATSTPSGQVAELKLGDSLEISLDPATFGATSSITQVRFYTQDPDSNPGAIPAYTYSAGNGIVNATIGGANYRMWPEGNTAFLIANHEGESLIGNRQPVWFQVDARDSSGNNWTLDPELINDGGNADGGPGWTAG